MRALSSRYQFKIFTRHELEDDFFDDVDLVAVPGGIGDSAVTVAVQRLQERPRQENGLARAMKAITHKCEL
jgi:hypothetical protein